MVEALPSKIREIVIRANHRPFFNWFFRIYSGWMLRLHFRSIIIHGDFVNTDLPVLLIGNHFSWWDGFIANILNIKIFRKKFHIMMLEEQLHQRMFLNKAGAYSIQPKSRSVIESLDYTVELLQDVKHLVVLYPQGEFQSLHRQEVNFQPGINRVFSALRNPVQIVFYIALTDYFSHRKPTLTVYLRQLDMNREWDAKKLESSFNDFLMDCVTMQKPD